MTKKSKISIILSYTDAKRLTAIFCALCVMVCILFTSSSVHAQLKVYPLPKSSAPTSEKIKAKNTAARTQELHPRSLPFWDDFSWTQVDEENDTLANYPLDSLWVNNYTVWINSGLGLNPPSINVATFNGLSATNAPYSDQQVANGFRDTLVSQPIRLDEVPEAERSTVFLSFFYQWNGNGEPPDPKDYLRVDFKNDQGVWEPIVTIATDESFTADQFYDTLVQVQGERFFHESFQFRFMNYGRLSGPYDTWNLDYVYLNKYRDPDDRYLPDRTIVSTLTNLFNGYRAVPYHHFLNSVSNPIGQPSFDVFNVKNDTSTLSYSVTGIFTNYKDSIGVTTVEPLGTERPIDGPTGVIYERERKTVTLQLQNVPDRNNMAQFDPDADSVDVELKVLLYTGDTFNRGTNEFATDYNPAIFQPLDFRSNDTLSAKYTLHNYYAYDDGFADYAVGLTSYGNRAAYLFEMLTEESDTLIGFDIYYPDYGVTGTLTVDFYVYDDADGLPGSAIYTLPSYTLRRGGLNNFDEIRFVDQQFLVDNRFYIGWKAPVGGTFKVGLDTNNDSGTKLYINTNGTWAQNTDVIGSVMIRPVFGSGNVITGIPEEKLQSQIFPNPNDGAFFIPSTYELIDVTTVTGRSIPFSLQDQGENQRVQLTNISPGMYILRLRSEQQIFSSKIVVK